jgi:ADP-heptose:LPS heptosyltransferase
VGRAERAAGRPVAVTGGPAEVELARSVARAAGLSGSAVLAGRTDLRGLTAAVAAAGRMVSNDTGVAHLATALRCPSVIVFGPAPADVWAPPAWRTWHRVLWSGRSGDPHAGEPHPSLLEIGVDAVLAALAELPERTDVPAPTTRHGPAS